MTRADANRIVEAYGQSHALDARLSAKGFAGITFQDCELYFEWDEPAQTLECSALMYRFTDPPKPGVLEALNAKATSVDTGGGKVDFEPENLGLFLSRRYFIVPDSQQFERDMTKLTDASKRWSDEVLPRVAREVFHPETL